MIRFYGAPMSSAGRTLWTLEEIGVPYEYTFVDPREGSVRPPEFLRVSPGGRVPAIDDDGFCLFESIAINNYLAEKYKSALLGDDARERALVQQWSLWAITNLQPEPFSIFLHTTILPPGDRDPKAVPAAAARAMPMLRQLERHLSGRRYMVSDRFTLADINVGSVVTLAKVCGLVSDHRSIGAWLDGLGMRPAYNRMLGDGRAE